MSIEDLHETEVLDRAIRQFLSSKCACCWLSVVSVVCLLTIGWMYICLIAFNDQDDLNLRAFQKLSVWVNWYMVVIILSAVLAIYCFLLLLFALFQVALREPLDLQWLHKVFLFVGVLVVSCGIAGVSAWDGEWHTVHMSLQATAPFLQLGGVASVTLVSPLVFRSYHGAKKAVSKVLIMVAFVGVSAMVFLSPYIIHSPCLVDQLPPKPALIGHRGAPMLAPENTMMSFRRSMECNVTAFETDVQLSKDNVPFLMHDHGEKFLQRTTNVKDVYPGREHNKSTDYTWEELQALNAGDWFVKTDPFRTASSLSLEERELAGNQSVPSLAELLALAKEHRISLIFDLKNSSNDTNNDTNYTVETILGSGISQDLIWWLPPTNRTSVMERAPGFRQVFTNVTQGEHLNMKYSALSASETDELRRRNVTVNLWVVNERWLFSLLWCSGASSVTTNSCHLLKEMSQPDWQLGRGVYRIIWITTDLVSLLLMFVLFHFQRQKRGRNQIFRLESERTVPLLTI